MKYLIVLASFTIAFTACQPGDSTSSMEASASSSAKACSNSAYLRVVRDAKESFMKEHPNLEASVGIANSKDATWVTRTAKVNSPIAGLRASECSISLGFTTEDDAIAFAKSRVKATTSAPQNANVYTFKTQRIRIVGKVVGEITPAAQELILPLTAR